MSWPSRSASTTTSANAATSLKPRLRPWRAIVGHGADDAGLAVFPFHRLDAGHVAQLRIDAVGGDQKPCLQRGTVGQMHGDAGAVRVEGADGHAFDDVDAELCGAPAQRPVE